MLGRMSDMSHAADGQASKLVELKSIVDGCARLVCTLKCWIPLSGGEVRWELRRLMPAVAFAETAQTHISRHMKENWTVWEQRVV